MDISSANSNSARLPAL